MEKSVDDEDKITYKMIGESLIFKEDDRHERPFIVCQIIGTKIKCVWFIIYDIYVHKIIGVEQVHITKFSLEYVTERDIFLCAS